MEKNLIEFLKQLKAFGVENKIPNITETNARFLRDIILLSGAKRALEIGTANGYSTIQLASALRNNSGEITSIEFAEEAHLAAKKNVEVAGVNNVRLIHADALAYIPTVTDNDFDFVFIDGMKRRTKDFFLLVYPKVKKGWVIIVDDVIKFREKMMDFYEYLAAEEIEYNVLPIDLDDGIMMIVKGESALSGAGRR